MKVYILRFDSRHALTSAFDALLSAPDVGSCMIESAISVAAAVHLAVAKSDVITKVDLDGPSLGQFNPVEGGVIFDESEITITDAPGLGIREIRGLEPLAR